MKPLTYGSLFSGTECMSAAARQVLDFIALKAALNYKETLIPVSVREFMAFRGSKSKVASMKRLKGGLEEIYHTVVYYRGDCSIGMPTVAEAPTHYIKLTPRHYGGTRLLGCLCKWKDEDGNNPSTYACLSSLFITYLIYAALTNQNSIKMI